MRVKKGCMRTLYLVPTVTMMGNTHWATPHAHGHGATGTPEATAGGGAVRAVVGGAGTERGWRLPKPLGPQWCFLLPEILAKRTHRNITHVVTHVVTQNGFVTHRPSS